MPFQVSPGVNVSEIDLTTVVPAVSTTEGAIAGVFRWGPVNKVVLIDSETSLVNRFGKPTNFNAETFFTAANFLSYGNKLYVVRAANTTSVDSANSANSFGSFNAVAVANSTGTLSSSNNISLFVVGKDEDIDTTIDSINTADDEVNDVAFIARYPGDLGNSLKVSVCDSSQQYSSNDYLPALSSGAADANLSSNAHLTTIYCPVGSTNALITIAQSGTGVIAEAVNRATSIRSSIASGGNLLELGNNTIGTQKLGITSVSAVSNTSSGATFKVTFDSKYTLPTFGNYNIDVVPTSFNIEFGDSNVFTTDATSNNTFASSYIKRQWLYSDTVDSAPGRSDYMNSFGNSNTSVKDELHVVVTDEDGKFTGVPGTILEVYEGLSRASDAKTNDGASNYIKDVINQNSRYIYFAVPRQGVTQYANGDIGASYTNTAINLGAISSTAPSLDINFVLGSAGASDESNVSLNTLISGYDNFKSAEDIDISLLLQGKARGGTNGEQLANHLIDNIAESRKDCVVFVSPDKADVVLNGAGDEAADIVTFRNSITSTSYAVLDSGYKYQYDKYNDVYRYVPLNGDVAGLCVRTDDTRDPWYSPAGFNRGVIKNTIKLAFNPGKADRDQLYKAGINPVVTFPGQGTLLFGDKTLLAKPSAFDRINVRRLFIVLEKAIATAAKFTLFEFNDEFTRAQFKNLVEPFLRDVQGRRGIYDFKVVCDETNNTGEVIDRNEFVGDIYIKPAKAINFIQLNFVAVRTGVEFSEVVGQF